MQRLHSWLYIALCEAASVLTALSSALSTEHLYLEVQGLYIKPQAGTRAKEGGVRVEGSSGLSMGALAQDKLLLIEIIAFLYLKIKEDKDFLIRFF